MILRIERWIANNSLSKNAESLFEESIKAYKTGAYKAGLLYSYLALMVIVKERITASAIPPGVPAGQWTDFRSKLLLAEVWDSYAFDATQLKTPAPIFPISDTLRREISYWRDRRNDCAHYKNENIEYHHVESLWTFIETHLAKIVVNGGMNSLVIKFQNHFNPSLTAPGIDYTPLIQEIQSAVTTAELPTFFAQIENDLGAPDHYYQEVFNDILITYSNNIEEALINYLKADKEKTLSFLREYPERFAQIALDATDIRLLWHDKLFERGRNDWDLYTGMLAGNVIAPADIEQSHQQIAGRCHHVPNAAQVHILEQAGFYPVLANVIFPSGGLYGYARANFYAPLIIHYMTKFPITEVVVRSITATFSFPLEPTELEGKLRQFFADVPGKAAECTAILTGPPRVPSIILNRILGTTQP